MPVRTMPWTSAATAAAALAAALVGAGVVSASPAVAATSPTAGASCPSGTLSLRTLESGCTTSTGTVRLADGRTFAVPARGESVAALSVAAAGAEELPEVVVTNTGNSGVAVRVGEAWQGSPSAVRQAERSTLGTADTAHTADTGAATVRPSAASTKCTSKANTQNDYRWSSTVQWYYNPSGTRTTYGDDALRSAADAWTGTITSCGTTVTSSARESFVREATQAPDLTKDGGCATNNGYSVMGWGALPAGTLGVTCVWYDQNGVAREADQRYATRYSWSSTATCSGSRYDMQAVATHEWGHLYGLGHVASGTGQVMEPSGGTCATGSRTLGLGDMTGIAAKY
ncbi:hypothetical protein JOE58_002488 [Curtobacterium luteum]|uniref:Peptidase M10 metallopeptidase domain-containing protein n=1 Tax=Curtobacterium luteum TaxID=33881 RepID=A0A8H9L1Q1_9MICO|nr:matrixin family metalloprotease [Curtobacterium luteum]MBM7803237.1 hypothetical protein [Curtobacterium luteum]NUU50885.1 matrixin family metalloprotease [Curtobacterium luteum]GGK95095.1 hypothetical protein GCM10009769_11450 [Curtobacterium luteum]